MLLGVSRSFEGIDPPLERARGECDDYPWLFTLNYAEILTFKPAHDPDHGYKWDTGARGADSLKHLGRPEVVSEFNRLDLAEQGFWGWPKCGQLLP